MLPGLITSAVHSLLLLTLYQPTVQTSSNLTDTTTVKPSDTHHTASMDTNNGSSVNAAGRPSFNPNETTVVTTTVPFHTVGMSTDVFDERPIAVELDNVTEGDIVDESQIRDDSNATEATSRGWEWYPLVWSWWHILQAIISLLGVVGNGIVIVVIYQRIAVIKSTETLIGALAISDFLTSVFLFPIHWAQRVPATLLGRVYCKLLYPSFFLWFAITSSANILMGICIERYLAVVHPLYFNHAVRKRKVTLVVLAIWFLTFLEVAYTLLTFVHNKELNYCDTTIKTAAGMIANAYYAFFVRLVIPVLTMLITQILIARSLKKQAKPFKDMVGTRDAPALSFHMVARNRIIKMMLIVVIVYVVTWTPNQIAYLCFNLGYIPQSYRGSPLHRVLGVIGFLNSCINPFIYASRNRAFRESVKGLFLCTKTTTMSPFESIEKGKKQSMNLPTIADRPSSSVGSPLSKI